MSLAAVVSMVVICTVVFGGFSYFVYRASQDDKRRLK